MKIRRLRISQQLLIVFIVGVVLPLCITALIVTNINQHAVRAELSYSAMITLDSVYQRLEKNLEEKKLALLYIAKGINSIDSNKRVQNYINEASGFSDGTLKIEIIKNDENINKNNAHKLFKDTDVEIFSSPHKKSVVMYAKLDNGAYLRKIIYINKLKKDLFKYLVNNKRPVYIIDSGNNIVMSLNEDKKLFNQLLPLVPDNQKNNEPIIFGKIKNQPNVFLKINKPDWSIIVLTPRQLTHYGIIDARMKIIVAIIVAALSTIVFGILYSYSLNTNLKQLFKAISAMGRGNYRRKVRLLKDFFTPHEIVFLMEKFNEMALKVDEGYMKIHEANEKLSKLDKLKSNLIDTVSHEFRTPLTCIKGYTSRLLRNDINIDEDLKTQSLKAIKHQTERLGRLVDDLLVVPEIEAEFLRVFPSEIDLKDVIENSIHSIQGKEIRVINLDIEENMPLIMADYDRLTQVMMNLLENAVKYSPEDSQIGVKVSQDGDFATVLVKNDSNPIEEEKLQTLFDKFVRLEEDLTRTTRGTGLGLFIVRGLVHAMGGEVFLNAQNGFEVRFIIPINNPR